MTMTDDEQNKKMAALIAGINRKSDDEHWKSLTEAFARLDQLGTGVTVRHLEIPRDKHWIRVTGDTIVVDVSFLLDHLKHVMYKATAPSRHDAAQRWFLERAERLEAQEKQEEEERGGDESEK